MKTIIKHCQNLTNVTKSLSEKNQQMEYFNENNYLTLVQAIDASEYFSSNHGDAYFKHETARTLRVSKKSEFHEYKLQ